MEIVAEIIPDEDLTNLKDDVPIREQVELDSMDFLDIIMELRKRYGIEVPEDDYMQLATIDSSVAYLEPRMKDI
jgi:acyl carrier protein